MDNVRWVIIMFKEIVGNKIKALRMEKGLSQEKLANECGLDRTYITYVGNAKKNITIETLFKITQALNISLKDFFDMDESEFMPKKKEKLNLSMDDLEVNRIYNNLELASIFSCSTQGGMRVSLKNNTVTLINQEYSKVRPYNDTEIKSDGSFIYTGMGLEGDQQVSMNNQNGKVAFSDTNGFRLHYFIGIGKNQYKYIGEVKKNGDYYFEEEPDQNGIIRKVVKFPLKLI